MDEEQKPIEVPSVLATTPEEERRYLEAEYRRSQRKKMARELKRRREILLALSVGLNIISMVIAAILFYSYFSVQKEKPSGCSVS